jgi:hypothetical protein
MMRGTCPVCDTPGIQWWICAWGIVQEVVCVSCGLWATRIMGELKRRKA